MSGYVTLFGGSLIAYAIDRALVLSDALQAIVAATSWVATYVVVDRVLVRLLVGRARSI